MKTIEERAEAYMNNYPNMDDIYYDYYVRDGYIQGATDQQAIDLANAKSFAKKWLDEIIQLWLPDLKDEPYYTKAQNDIMSKLEKAMKR